MSEETFGYGVPREFGTGATAVADTDLPPELEGEGGYEFTEPESGDFLPRILPGSVTFRYEEQEFLPADGVKGAQIVWAANVQTADFAPGRVLRGADKSELRVAYNRASGKKPAPFKNADGKMQQMPSGFEKLYACLGLVNTVGVPGSQAQLEQTLRGAGGLIGRGKLAWEATVKLDDGTIETFTTARKKERRVEAKGPYAARVTKPWPVNADGTLPVRVIFSNGDSKVGRETIAELYPAKKVKP